MGLVRERRAKEEINEPSSVHAGRFDARIDAPSGGHNRGSNILAAEVWRVEIYLTWLWGWCWKELTSKSGRLFHRLTSATFSL